MKIIDSCGCQFRKVVRANYFCTAKINYYLCPTVKKGNVTPEQKYKIDYQGLTIGKHDFRFAIGDDIFTLWEESEIKKGSLTADITLTKHSSMMELEVRIMGDVEVACDRCLENLLMPVKYRGELIVKISDMAGEDDADTMWLNPADSTIPLAQYLYESIILNLPYERIHPSIEQCNPDMLSRFTIIDPDDEADETYEADE